MAAMPIVETKKHEWWRRYFNAIKPTHWMCVIRNNGNMEIYSMPDLKLVYLITNIGNGNTVLMDSMEYVQMPMNTTGESQNQSLPFIDLTMPVEILLVGLGSYGSRPLLLLRTKSEILIYSVSWPIRNFFKEMIDFIFQVFRYVNGHLKIRFKKMPHSVLNTFEQPQRDGAAAERYTNKLRYFGKIVLLMKSKYN